VSRKQLLLLFVSCLVPWIVRNGLIPLLPLFALQLGATSAVTGYYLSFSTLALAAGSVCAGWLSDRLQRRKIVLILAGTLMFFSLWMMGRVTNMWQLTAVTVTTWFLAGLEISTVNILGGLFAGKDERGRVFGLLGISMPLGGILGGLSIGPIVDRWGF
jgi:MFS family permease